jgi:hypothetical protein
MATPELPVGQATVPLAVEIVEPLASLPMRRPRALPAALRVALWQVGIGLAVPAAAAATARQRAIVAQLRRSQRRPGSAVVVAGAGGAGATSVAAGIALVLAALRPGPTVLVDVQAGTVPLGPRLASRSRLEIVDGVRWHETAHPSNLRRLLDRAADSNGFVMVDAGDETGPGADAAIRCAGRVVVATTAGPGALDTARAALQRVHRIAPEAVDDAVVAVVCRRGRGCRRATAALRWQLRSIAGPVVPVPYDRGLATGWLSAGGHWRPAVRDAYLTLAGLVAGTGQEPDTGGA